MSSTGEPTTARRMWSLYEPIHDVVYFTPLPRAAFEAAGLRGFWRGYFAGRVAPLGPVGAPPVVAAFVHFAPSMVSRALPGVWQLATPERALAARQEGATAGLAELCSTVDGEVGTAAGLAEAVDLIEEAVAGLDCTGRVLGAANAALPRPEQPLARLWQATTTLREYRGDAHVAALVLHGLGGCEVLAWRCGVDQSREVLQPARGWTDEQWDAAQERLVARGWLDRDGRATGEAMRAHREIEDATDRASEAPWQALGPRGTQRLAELLDPLARACRKAMPQVSPVGLPPA